MKKISKLCLGLCLVFSLVACSNKSEPNTEKKEDPIQTNGDETSKFLGTIVDATMNEFMIKSEAGDSLRFQREGMELNGASSLQLGEIVEVTYYVKDNLNIATICNVQGKTEDNPGVTTENTIDNMIDKMSVEEKVGQMFFVRVPEQTGTKDVNTYHLGGYILFDRDFKGRTYNQVVKQIAKYQTNAKVPLLIGVDEEGGTVNRVSNYFRETPFHSPQYLYRNGGYAFIKSDTKEKAKLLLKMGINVNLAPDSDVSTNKHDFINARSFGKNAKETSTYVKTVVQVMKENRIGSTLKHFPGYGNNIDTHTGIAIDNRSLNSFRTSDFLPFEAGIKAGVDSILVSHNVVKSMDANNPASLSTSIHNILRNELGFKGVIMSDDLAMDAIRKYTDEDSAALAAVKAGNDLLICSNYQTQIPTVIKAVKQGKIKEAQIDASLKRILKWKESLGLLTFD